MLHRINSFNAEKSWEGAVEEIERTVVNLATLMMTVSMTGLQNRKADIIRLGYSIGFRGWCLGIAT